MEFDMVQALMPGFKAALGSPVVWGILVVGGLIAYLQRKFG